MLNGACKYCGQVQSVDAKDQAMADKMATENCNCPDAIRGRRKDRLIEQIADIAEADYEDTGFYPMSDDIYKLVCILAEKCVDGELRSIKLTIEDRTITIKSSSKGDVSFNQTRTIEVGAGE